MLRVTPAQLDFGKLLKRAKRLDPQSGAPTVRIALIGDCALQQLVPLLKALFASASVNAEIYEAGYDTADLEVIDPSSGLYAFNPQAVVVIDSGQHLRDAYFATTEDRASFAKRAIERITRRWDTLASRTGACVVQSNFVTPYERPFGNYEIKVPHSLSDAFQVTNRGLIEEARARKSVFINDLDFLASYVGRRSWFDEKLWVLGKTLCALEHLPAVAQNIVDIVLASRGVGVKCVVLDLDNTLWGGVIGDDGIDGIRIGHLEDGEAFTAMQRFARELSGRGIILAVCSKNEHANAILPFREHPEMVLREKDIAMFVANWDDKARNISHIKETLNIGYDAIVFIDDNPFERNLVAELLPEVIVPTLPDDPAEYVKALSELNLFETASFSELDKQRVELYKSEAKREETKRAFANVDEYLQSLEMRIDLRRFEAPNLPRIAQLILRSNQWNLATRRYSEAQCEALMHDATVYPISVNLKDRFGDHGLISVAILRVAGEIATIDEYLMSCRVLQRGVEHFVMSHLFEEAKARGARRVQGFHIPTAKNAMVAELYARFGFELMERKEDGTTQWGLDVASYVAQPTHIQVERPQAALQGS